MGWTHKVVKRMRGSGGQMFELPTAATFTAERAAVAYAEAFAREQHTAGILTAEIEVRSRKKHPAEVTGIPTHRVLRIYSEFPSVFYWS